MKNVKSDVNHLKSPLKCVLLIEAFPFAYQLYSTTLWPLGPGPLYAGLVEGRCHHGGQLAPWEAPRRRGAASRVPQNIFSFTNLQQNTVNQIWQPLMDSLWL